MAPESCATHRSLCVTTLVDPARELDKLAGAQGPARLSNARSDEAPTSPKAITPLLIPSTKDLFTKLMKVFMEMMQAQVQALV